MKTKNPLDKKKKNTGGKKTWIRVHWLREKKRREEDDKKEKRKGQKEQIIIGNQNK